MSKALARLKKLYPRMTDEELAELLAKLKRSGVVRSVVAKYLRGDRG